MVETPPSKGRISSATLALAAAGLLAVAAVGIAVFRSGEPAGTAPENNMAAAQQPAGTVEEMVARLEERVRQDPDNPEDWRLLGWTYFELARQTESPDAVRAAFARSAAAYRRAAELEPNNAENWSSLGEALQVASSEVSPEAERAFARALQLVPTDPRARYFTAVHKDLRGQHEAAVNDWLALLRDTPAGAPWEADLRRTIQQTADRHHIDLAGRLPAPRHPAVSSATAAIPGPTREQMEAARGIPPSQQDEMVRGMVERLNVRLRQNPRDADGWMMLMRSRMVLNDPNGAREALRSGLAAFQNDAATQQRLRTAASQLGVPAA